MAHAGVTLGCQCQLHKRLCEATHVMVSGNGPELVCCGTFTVSTLVGRDELPVELANVRICSHTTKSTCSCRLGADPMPVPSNMLATPTGLAAAQRL